MHYVVRVGVGTYLWGQASPLSICDECLTQNKTFLQRFAQVLLPVKIMQSNLRVVQVWVKFTSCYSNPHVQYLFFFFLPTTLKVSRLQALESWQWWMSLIEVDAALAVSGVSLETWQGSSSSEHLCLPSSHFFPASFLFCLSFSPLSIRYHREGREGRTGRRRCSSEWEFRWSWVLTLSWMKRWRRKTGRIKKRVNRIEEKG